jgi:hypothetical protein
MLIIGFSFNVSVVSILSVYSPLTKEPSVTGIPSSSAM